MKKIAKKYLIISISNSVIYSCISIIIGANANAVSTCGIYSGSTVNVTGSLTTACEINSGNNLTITSNGSIVTGATTSAGQSAVQLSDGNVLINNGTIDANGSQLPLLIQGSNSSTITNTGTIINSTSADSGIKNTGNIGVFTNTPGLTSSETAIISAPQVAIINSWGTIGSLINDGSILSTLTGNNGDAYGILSWGTIGLIQNKANGLIQSQGISATSSTGFGDAAIANVWSGQIGTIENQSGAKIYGAVNAISNGASFEQLQESKIDHIINAGEISGTQNGLGVGIFNNGAITDITNSSNGIGNNGRITGKFAGLVNATYGQIGEITNNTGARISGASSASSNTYGIGNDGQIDAIKNSGYITGGNTGISNTGLITEITNLATGVISGNQASTAVGIYNTSSPSTGGTTAGQIGVITNAGTIVSYGVNGAGIDNTTGTSITTLNNAQGNGNSAGPLTYKGTLPSYYNIIINSPNSFGRLSLLSVPAGLMAFNIYGNTGTTLVSSVNASVVQAYRYLNVLQGFGSLSGISGTTGTYGGYNYSLVADATTANSWDLLVTLIAPPGPSTADTQASLVNTASALQNTYTLQNSVLANSFTYDCSLFDKNNICVSAGGRYTAVQSSGLNNTSALLIGAYRPHPNYRVGGYLDQNLSVNNSGSTISLSNGAPLFGLFGVWNERTDGTGTEVKVSAAIGQKNTTITRQIVGTSEAGSGSSNLNSQGAQIIAKYGFGVVDNLIVSPYAGIRYTQNNMGGYTEATTSSVTAPLTYSALNTNATTAMAGVGASYRVVPQAMVFASAGVESDTNTNNGTYSATGVTGLTPVSFNPSPVKTRATATLGAYYDIEKNHRVGITGIYRQEPFQSISTTSVLATYTVGL